MNPRQTPANHRKASRLREMGEDQSAPRPGAMPMHLHGEAGK